jgi:hypothetical protein
LIYDIPNIKFDKSIISDFFEVLGFIYDIWTERIPGNGIVPKIYSFPKFGVIRFSVYCPSLLMFSFLTVYS